MKNIASHISVSPGAFNATINRIPLYSYLIQQLHYCFDKQKNQVVFCLKNLLCRSLIHFCGPHLLSMLHKTVVSTVPSCLCVCYDESADVCKCDC